jgi:1-acyl-sn-glycerol-3-phosphate acyltransferase
MSFLRAILFWFGFSILTILTAILLILTKLVRIPVQFGLVRVWSLVNLKWLKITQGLDFVVEGIENIGTGPAVVMGNHQSAWETIVCQLYFSPSAWVLKRELLWIPVFGWGLWTMNPIAINRGKGKRAVTQLLEIGNDRLEQNYFILIFPEGTRVPPHKTKKYKMGGALLAEKTRVPVIPFAHNAGHFWPKNSFSVKQGCVKMVIGEPFDTTGMSAEEILRKTETWVRAKQEELKLLN